MFQSKLQWAIHHETESQRQKVLQALALLDSPKWNKQSERLENCCSYGALHLSSDPVSDPRLWVSRCGVRACPVCSRARSGQVARKIADYTRHLHRPRHITLTMPASGGTLRSQITRLKEAFRKLRRTRLWKHTVDGGFYCVEITRKTVDHAWHPHLHIIYGGNFLLQADLAEAWRDCEHTGHPMEIGYAFISDQLPGLLEAFNRDREASHAMPWLAALVCCSINIVLVSTISA